MSGNGLTYNQLKILKDLSSGCLKVETEAAALDLHRLNNAGLIAMHIGITNKGREKLLGEICQTIS